MNVDGLGALALAVVAAEWLALGWLSGIVWPGRALWAAVWGLRLLVGAWLVALAQLLLALLGAGFASLPLVLAVAAALAGMLRACTRNTRTKADVSASRDASASHQITDWRELAGWLLLAAVLIAASVRALVVPEAGWDAYSHWGLKAQAYALAGTIVDTRSTHEYYPPLVPLLEAWLFVHQGAPAIDLGKTVWPLVGAAFTSCVAWHLRLVFSTQWLAPYFATAIVLGTTQLLESFWTGQADLALTTYLTLATLAGFQWLHKADRAWLVQLAVFGAAAALTKYEGLPRLGVLLAALLVETALRRERAAVAASVALFVGASLGAAPWLVFRALHGIHVTSEHVSHFQPQAVLGVLQATAASLSGVRTGGGVLATVLSWIAAGGQLWEPPLRLLTLVVAGQLVATLLGLLISETAPAVQAQTSATRLIQQFLPVALFVGAIALERLVRCATYNRRWR